MQAIVTDLNRTLPGWFGYFQYSHWTIFRAWDAKAELLENVLADLVDGLASAWR